MALSARPRQGSELPCRRRVMGWELRRPVPHSPPVAPPPNGRAQACRAGLRGAGTVEYGCGRRGQWRRRAARWARLHREAAEVVMTKEYTT